MPCLRSGRCPPTDAALQPRAPTPWHHAFLPTRLRPCCLLWDLLGIGPAVETVRAPPLPLQHLRIHSAVSLAGDLPRWPLLPLRDGACTQRPTLVSTATANGMTLWIYDTVKVFKMGYGLL